MRSYYYNETLRQGFGFETPNYAALFLALAATLLAGIAVSVRAGRRWSAVLLPVEAVAWYGLCTTYSRGGFVAGWAGLLYLAGVRMYAGELGMPLRARLARAGLWITPRAIIATSCLFATSFHGRLSIGYSATDASVLNRLDLWRGAARMFVDARGEGWGLGMGARAFSEWYIPLDLGHHYLTFVNLFVTLAVDLGAVWFAITMLALGMLLAVPFFAGRDGSRRWLGPWIPTAGAVLMVFAVGNFFSVLLLSYACNTMAAIAIVALAAGFIRVPEGSRRWPVLGGMALAAGSVALLVAIGMASTDRELRVVVDVPANRIDLLRDTRAERVLWIAGRTAPEATDGRALRHALHSQGRPVRLTTSIHPSGNARGVSEGSFDTAILWGEQWTYAREVKAAQRLLVFPSRSDERAEHIRFDEVILAPADTTGENAYWSARAAAIQARIRLVEPGEVMRVVLGGGGES